MRRWFLKDRVLRAMPSMYAICACAVLAVAGTLVTAAILAIHASRDCQRWKRFEFDSDRVPHGSKMSFVPLLAMQDVHPGFGTVRVLCVDESRPQEVKSMKAYLEQGSHCRLAMAMLADYPADVGTVLEIMRCGWPFKCCEGSILKIPYYQSVASSPSVQISMNCATMIKVGGKEAVIPYGIVWSAFVADVVISSILLYGMVFVLNLIIMLIRRIRGRCAVCGYSMMGAVGNICPECGTGFVNPVRFRLIVWDVSAAAVEPKPAEVGA